MIPESLPGSHATRETILPSQPKVFRDGTVGRNFSRRRAKREFHQSCIFAVLETHLSRSVEQLIPQTRRSNPAGMPSRNTPERSSRIQSASRSSRLDSRSDDGPRISGILADSVHSIPAQPSQIPPRPASRRLMDRRRLALRQAGSFNGPISPGHVETLFSTLPRFLSPCGAHVHGGCLF
ncbi:hypothetical protein KM043_000654 [Ampulex compressa]|nr:hypothetical protein KM043_000654 [Ampulex compressa]